MRVVVIILICLLSIGSSLAAPPTWAEAVAPLVDQRAKAEICVALVKRDGKSTEVSDLMPKYAKAKAESDALITGLLVALAGRGTPSSLPSLQDRVAKSYANLADFCNSVEQIIALRRPPGERDAWSALAKILGIDNLVNKMSDGVATLFNYYVTQDELTRKFIRIQLESAKWPDFSTVPAPP